MRERETAEAHPHDGLSSRISSGGTGMHVKSRWLWVLASVASLAVGASRLEAATYNETGDAGQTIASAQAVLGPPATPLDHIIGALGNGEADIFQIFLTGGQTFSASTTQPSLLNAFDTSLLLFDASGLGVYANDDDVTQGGNQSFLPPGISLTPSASGVYFLAITHGCFEPLDGASGPIFPVISLCDPIGTASLTDVRGGEGGAGTLASWTGSFLDCAANSCGYDILLTGAEFVPVPGPSPIWLLLLGLAIGLGLARPRKAWRLGSLLVTVLVLGPSLQGPALAQPGAVPPNLGAGLGRLVQMYHTLGPRLDLSQPNEHHGDEGVVAPLTGPGSRASVDANGRVLVEIYLDGALSMDAAKRLLASKGAQVTGAAPNYRRGMISAFIPLGEAIGLAATPGIASMSLSRRPITRVGATTSQGVIVHRTDSTGRTGAGITVGILSDSYDTCGADCSTTAAQDVASGDLPNGPVSGLEFLIDLPPGDDQLDEGRGMAQLIFDLAPGTALCFATAFTGQTAFADNIRTLRTNPDCHADVIVDDVFYFAEPFFSDGVIAQAVDDVVNSTTLPGHRVSYFSSAGNDARFGYASNYRHVDKATALGLPGQPVDLSTIPAALLDLYDGFHDWDPGAGTTLAQTFLIPGGGRGNAATYDFQWDDAFGPGNITTDFDLLLFTNAGAFQCVGVVPNCIGADDNFSTHEALELFFLFRDAGDEPFKFVIARRSAGAKRATRLKLLVFGPVYAGNFIPDPRTVPLTFGHSAANGAVSVGAYMYDNLPNGAPNTPPFKPLLESFSSPGPALITHDGAGVRLASPEVRRKPDVSAVDRTNTTFFIPGVDYEGDGFPNFSGTSASAPHAAAIAALMLEKAMRPGGPGRLTGQQVKSFMINSMPARDIDKYLSKAVAPAGSANVTVTATGDNVSSQSAAASAFDSNPNFFRVSHTCTGQTLTAMTINLSGAGFHPAGMLFHPAAAGGFGLAQGGGNGPTITSPSPGANTATLNLTFNGFASGGFLTFGIDRIYSAAGGRGPRSADVLEGGTVSATLTGAGPCPGAVNATFANQIGKGYTIYDGYGLVDAVNAVDRVP